MADVVQELVIALGLDSSGLVSGINKAVASVGSAANNAASGVSAVGRQAGKSLLSAGDDGARAAKNIATSFGALDPVFMRIKRSVTGLGAALLGAFGTTRLFDNYISKADELGKTSRQLGISAQEIDAWSKANEAAGGSAEALQASLKAFYDKTGRPATEFFKLGEKIEGMSRRQTQAYLRAQGVAWDAIPVFLKGQKEAEALVAKYRKTAFTAQDAKNARAFKVAWSDFKIAAQDVGNVFLRTVLPPITEGMKLLERLVSHVRDNIQFFTILGGVLGAVFAVKNIQAIKAAALAVKAFGLSLKGALLPLTAIAAGIIAAAMAVDDLMTFAKGGDSIFGSLLKNLGMTEEEIGAIREVFSSVGDAIGSLWDALKPLFSGVISVALKAILVALVPILSLVALLVAGLAKVIRFAVNVGSALKDAFVGAFNAIVGLFSKIGEFIVNAILGAIKSVKGVVGSVINGILSAFGVGSDDNPKGSTAVPPRNAQGVMEQQAKTPQGAQITTNASMNVTNNIQTRDNPQAIAGAVGNSVGGAVNRMSNLTGQSMRGVNYK